MKNSSSHPTGVPIIDVGAGREELGRRIGEASREAGFFYVVGHDVDPELEARLVQLSRVFFALDEPAKMALRMELGGRAWRGYFPVGAELTLGRPDQKEGLYLGAELPPDHPRVVAGVPLHGANLFPDLPGFRETILAYMDALTRLGHALMEGFALGLGLEPSFFADRYTADPLVLFRIFNYPALARSDQTTWSVGEHTDYGLLTILLQDENPGLQVKTRARWVDVPPVPGSFVCNIGDMLERMTGGVFRSTPHRVRNTSGSDRLSFPFFFDPDFDAQVEPVFPHSQAGAAVDDGATRWDGQSVHELGGTYGEYLLGKVSKVFPALGEDVL